MSRFRKTGIVPGICLMLMVGLGFWVKDQSWVMFQGPWAFAGDDPPASGSVPLETEPAPCPECPECPDPAKVVLRGLEDKKAMIEQQQKSLEEARKALKAYEEQIDEKIKSLAGLKQQIEADLALLEQKKSQKEMEKEAEYEAKIGRLVKMYAGMKPKNAAQIVDQMDLEVAQEIFVRMRETNASEILAFVNSEKAAKISERLAFKRKP